jgi:hypothetical protein
LLGVGGLLPADLTRHDPGTDHYLRQLWDRWWRDREAFADCCLPRAAWRFHGLRPANHPQRRLAMAAHWLLDPNAGQSLEQWLAAEAPDDELVSSLAGVLGSAADDFWSWHWTLRSPRLPRAQPLIGPQRVTDLAVNVILPWFLARAQAGDCAQFKERVQRRYCAWPAAEDNSLLRLARQRLLGGRWLRLPRTAAMQQGLFQIVRDFCDATNALCAGCGFTDLARRAACC